VAKPEGTTAPKLTSPVKSDKTFRSQWDVPNIPSAYQRWNRCRQSSSIQSDLEIGFTRSNFDGYRALAQRGGSEKRILSRNQNDLGKKFTEVRDSIAALDVDEVIID
jgi:hypothetical protein